MRDMSGVLQFSMGENCLGGEAGLLQEELLELELVVGLGLHWGLSDCLWEFHTERRLGLPSVFGFSLFWTLSRIFLYISIFDWVQSRDKEASAAALRGEGCRRVESNQF